MRSHTVFFVGAMLLFSMIGVAQVPVEVFAGNKKSTLDVMFFRFFKTKDGRNSKFLFFNRNRASIDYAMTPATNLPQFGFTEAVSYNDERLGGVAPVVVASILNRGVYPKAGVQFAKSKNDYLVFTWLVAETMKDPHIDFFFLGRYMPKLSGKLSLFSQIELVNTFPTAKADSYLFVQRFRLGLKRKQVQFGLGADFSALGRTSYTNTRNWGGFLRYEF